MEYMEYFVIGLYAFYKLLYITIVMLLKGRIPIARGKKLCV